MSDERKSNFFSTEDEFNERNSALNNGATEEIDYGKYLNDYDDGEEIVLPSDNHEDKSDKKSHGKNNKSGKGKKSSSKKIVIALVCVILAILIAAGGLIGYFYHLSKPGEFNDDGIDYGSEEDIIAEEDLDFEAMGSVSDAASLNDYLYNWAHNKGEKMHSKNVINVLLCGVDTSDGQGRSDSMILVSVNKKSETVTLSSFFRDSYIYMDIPQESGGTKGRYEKINASYSLGGPATLIDTIEKNFKIEIDQYIMVDFASFKGIIDAVGGIDVDVSKSESDFIRRTSRQKNFPSGKGCHLNGTQALIYSRIRKLDSDVNRTERQRKVIRSLINSAQGATKGQLVNAYKKVAKYLRTGYTQSEVLSLIGTAVAQDWMSYKINEITLPAEEGVEMMSTYIHPTSSPRALQWVWVVDYPLCAQKLQLALYGESNIVLKEDRDTALSFMQANNVGSSGSSSGSGSNSSGSSYKPYTYSYTPSYYTTQPVAGGGEDVGGDVGGGEDVGGDVGGGDTGGDVGGGDTGGSGDTGGGGETPVTPETPPETPQTPSGGGWIEHLFQ